MISHSILRPPLMESPLGLRRKLSALKKLGLNLIGTRFLKPLFWRDPSSSFSYRSSDSLEIQDSVQPLQTLAVMNKPTFARTHLYAKRSTLRLTRPSTILDALRLRGSFSPSKGKQITSICPVTSGLQVQILSTREEKPTA